MEKKTIYGIWSWYCGWNLLYQYPRTYSLEEASKILQIASRNLPQARLKIDVVPEANA